MRKRRQGFLIHLFIFFIYHAGIFLLLHMDLKMNTSIQTYVTWIKEGKVGFFYPQTGIHVNSIWLIILIIDGSYAFFGKEKISKKQKEVFHNDSPLKKKEASKSLPQKAWGYLILGGGLEIVWASLLKAQMLGGPLLLIFFVCFYTLTNAAKILPVSTVYAVFCRYWSGWYSCCGHDYISK